MKCEFCDKLSFLKSLQRPERKDGISYTYKYSVAIIDDCLPPEDVVNAVKEWIKRKKAA